MTDVLLDVRIYVSVRKYTRSLTTYTDEADGETTPLSAALQSQTPCDYHRNLQAFWNSAGHH